MTSVGAALLSLGVTVLLDTLSGLERLRYSVRVSKVRTTAGRTGSSGRPRQRAANQIRGIHSRDASCLCIIIAVAAGSTVCRRGGIEIADANVVRVVHGEHQGAAEVRSHRSNCAAARRLTLDNWNSKGRLKDGFFLVRSNARFWHKADISRLGFNGRSRGKADIQAIRYDVCL